jgi:hypothetical protein
MCVCVRACTHTRRCANAIDPGTTGMAALIAYMSTIAKCYKQLCGYTTCTHLERDHDSKPTGGRAFFIVADKIITKVTGEADNQRIAHHATEAYKFKNW